MPVIKIKNLKKYFGPVKAVDDISFEVDKGEILGFLGPNGAGKTTTIRCMMDFVRPTSGKIEILGQDSQVSSVYLKRKVGFLSGDVRLYENWTGKDHINIIEKIRGKSKNVSDLIERLNFNPDIRFKNLSSGNKQKLGIILALMTDPEILILDEPTVGLDPLLQNTIYELLKEHRNKGRTICLSSHYLHEVELLCDRVVIIKDGKIAATETIANLKKIRLYQLTTYSDDLIDKAALEKAGAKVLEASKNHVKCQVKDDINPIISLLSKYKLNDVEINRASLEEIFLEYYKRN